MGLLHLISLSEASGNDPDAQRWMLRRMSNNVMYLGKVTHSTTAGTYNALCLLINKVCRLFAASGCDFHAINDLLQQKLEEVEGQYKPEEIEQAQKKWDRRLHCFEESVIALDARRGDELRALPMRYFFRPTRPR